MQNFSIIQWLSKLQARFFVNVCTFKGGQTVVLVPLSLKTWSEMVNGGITKYYKSQRGNNVFPDVICVLKLLLTLFFLKENPNNMHNKFSITMKKLFRSFKSLPEGKVAHIIYT